MIKCHDIMGFITVRVLKIERKTTLVWGICFFTFITGKVSFFEQNSTLRGMRNFLQKNDQKMIKKRSKNDQKNIIKNHQKKIKKRQKIVIFFEKKCKKIIFGKMGKIVFPLVGSKKTTFGCKDRAFVQ